MENSYKLPIGGINTIKNLFRSNPELSFVEIRRTYNKIAIERHFPILKSDSSIVNYLVRLGLYNRGHRMSFHKEIEIEHPNLPPRGWKKEVAKAAGCSEKTVYNAIRGEVKGPQSNKVMEVYKNMFGTITKTENIK